MTPLQIEIMLHYYCSPNDYRPSWRDRDEELPPSVIDSLAFLERADMLKRNGDPTSEPPVFTITDRGRAYVDKLRSIPMPTKKVTWEFPEAGGYSTKPHEYFSDGSGYCTQRAAGGSYEFSLSAQTSRNPAGTI